MKQEKSFFNNICSIAIPVSLQSMLQSSFSIVDQIMIGQLGSTSVASVGLAGKFTGIYNVLVAAFGAVAGIMIAQYIGQRNNREVKRSYYMNLIFSIVFASIFTLCCLLVPKHIMRLYTSDTSTIEVAASYLEIVSGTFLPMAGATLLATLFRCMEKASYPLYASIIAASVNTVLNYILIFGKLGFKAMGVEGAAIATLLSQCINFLIMLVIYEHLKDSFPLKSRSDGETASFNWQQYCAILLPMLVCELFWSLGENVYASIYGHLGTDSCAAMTLTYPVQGLLIGALCGLAQASSVIIGKLLGEKKEEEAYDASKKIMLYALIGSAMLSLVIILTRGLYVKIYHITPDVKAITQKILFAYALVAPFKVLNMTLGGGILRSGGKTKYLMYIDIIGTWIFGVPLGLLSAFIWHLSIPYVYFILSLEECVRFTITIFLFRSRKWMNILDANKE